MPEQYTPAEFAEILSSPDRPLIVGGQAVNVWAEYFATKNPHIAAQRPFVSKDADIFAERDLAEKLATAAGWQITFFHEPRTIAVAVLTKPHSGGGTLTVEVLREVLGLTRRELDDSDLVAFPDGHAYRIPSPIRLLKAKLANLRRIIPTRLQDAQHARLLVALSHDYITAQHSQVIAGHLKERLLINALTELADLIADPDSETLDLRFDLKLRAALPRNLPDERLPKLANFYKHHRGSAG